jgi:hypothetical protein
VNEVTLQKNCTVKGITPDRVFLNFISIVTMLLEISGFTLIRFYTISSLHLRDQIFKGSAKY